MSLLLLLLLLLLLFSLDFAGRYVPSLVTCLNLLFATVFNV